MKTVSAFQMLTFPFTCTSTVLFVTLQLVAREIIKGLHSQKDYRQTALTDGLLSKKATLFIPLASATE